MYKRSTEEEMVSRGRGSEVGGCKQEGEREREREREGEGGGRGDGGGCVGEEGLWGMIRVFIDPATKAIIPAR